MSSSVVVETIESKEHRLLIQHDGIIRVYCKPTNVELDDVKMLLSKFNEVRNDGEKLFVLMDPTEEESMTTEARKYMMHHLKDDISVLAVIGRKRYVRNMFKIVSAFVNVGVELKMFDSIETAEAWLKEKI